MLVLITPTTELKPKYYLNNARQWLPRLLDATVAADSSGSRYHASFLLCKALERMEPKAVDDVWRTAKKKGFGKMDVHRQLAMVDQANLTYSQLRVIRPFFIADSSCKNPLHSEHEMRKHELHSRHKPVFIDFKEEQYKRNGWYLPLDKIVEEFATSQAVSSGGTPQELHVILSADHGQGHWKANIACVLIANHAVVKEQNTVVASIECKKDKRQVLIDSGVPAKINELLHALVKNDTVADGNGAVPAAVAVNLFATGDLAWFAEALGKPNMSGDHCSLCQWRCLKTQVGGKANPRRSFPRWESMNQLKGHLNKLEDGELDRTDKSQECGVVVTPLIDAIEPPNYITPLLHCVTLFINTPFKYLHRWVWYRVEGVRMQLILAREEMALTAIAKDKSWEGSLEAQEHLQFMYAELDALSPEDDGSFDDKDHEAEYRQQKAVVQVAEEAVDQAVLDHETASAEARKAATQVNRLEGLKGHGRAHQDVWMAVENKLKELKVYSSAYHGGDLEGNQCRQLMKEAPTVMNAVKEIVLEHIADLPAEEKAKRADQAEVELFCSAFQRLFQYFDVVSHYCYQPFGSLTDSDLAKLQVAVDRLVDLYLNLLPTCPMKLHMIAVHLVPHARQFRGLKSHHESHIERAHQQGVRDRRRLGVLGSFAKKTISALKTEATAGKSKVQDMLADTQQRRKKRKSVDSLEEGAIGAQEERRDYLNGVLELPAIAENFPTLLELTKLSVVQE
jgi:cell division protein FtsB